MPSRLQLLASPAVCAYVRHFPIERGKWRLLRWASRFLVAKLEPGTYIRVSDATDSVEQAIVYQGLLEPEDVRFFLSLLEPGMTVFDVGANLGTYALLAARRVGPSGRLHAFEPGPATADRLRGNVRLNGLSNVVVNQAAVSDRAGVITLYLQDDSDCNTLTAGAGTPVQVPALTLDDYVGTHNLGQVDVLKMDVEGAEVTALRGGGRLLAAPRAPLILLEFNPQALEKAGSSVSELRQLLEGHAYRCHALQAYDGGSYYNVLAWQPWHRERFPALRARELTALA